jgi:5-methylcytosine-specific restriction endonuclease McrA
MSKKLSFIRKSAYSRQLGLCYYCKMPMWQGCSRSFQERYNLSPVQASRFMCTAEHLLARQDGGRDLVTNIVAACVYCNQHRHMRPIPLEPPLYEKLVTNRIKRNRWHGLEIIGKFQKAGVA